MERSNKYVFTYSIVLVIVVAALLSIAAYSLKDKQSSNMRKEKMQNLLTSIQIDADTKQVEELFHKHITGSFIIDKNGEVIPYIIQKEGKITDTITAFDINMKRVYSLPKSQRTLPVFEARKDNNSYLIIPVYGKGLWGPLWGFVSIKNDYNTIYGAVFDHQGETPGLGAEINKDKFEHMFRNKQLFDEAGVFQSVKVVKGGVSPDNKHAVDGISGGTITSNGVNDMIDTCLSGYTKYLQSLKQ